MHLMAQAPEQTKNVINDASREERILAGLRQRESAALRELVELYSRSLSRAAYLVLGDGDLAEDVVQETFIATWDGARRIRDASKLRSWLYGVLYNMCRKRRRKLTLVRRWEKAAIERRNRELGEDDGRIDKVRDALKKLNLEARMIVALRFERGMSVAETAEALDIPEGTVKSRTHTAIEELKRIMGVNHDQ